MYLPDDYGQQEPTGYEIESRSNVMGWWEIAQSMLEAVTEAYAMEPNQMCDICGNEVVFRCQQCGPVGFFLSGLFPLKPQACEYVPRTREVGGTTP